MRQKMKRMIGFLLSLALMVGLVAWDEFDGVCGNCL